jgi:proline iminopeptidase
MLLRSVCLTDRKESAWLYEPNGAAQVFPDAYEQFLSVLTPTQRQGSMETILRGYKRMLASPDMRIRNRAAAAWTGYEDAVISLIPEKPTFKGRTDLSVAILENHYFLNNAWIRPGQILKDAHKIRHIPLVVIHGRYDMICPYRSIQLLSDVLPKMQILRVDDGGHSGYGQTAMAYGRRITDTIVGSSSKQKTRKKRRQ